MANAASAAFFLFVQATGPPIFKDSLRLVLVIFLFASAFWAIIDFIATTTRSTSGCQVAIAFGSAFDQVARTAFEQFLLWGLNRGVRVSLGALIPQACIILRFILGGVYVGFQRSHFKPVCVPSTAVEPLGIAVLIVDALILLFFIIKLMSDGNPGNGAGKVAEPKRSKTFLLAIAAAGFWTAVSDRSDI